MAKFKIDNPSGTSLDPFALDKTLNVKQVNNNPLVSVHQGVEFNTEKTDAPSTLFAASKANELHKETLARDQGVFELIAKGTARIIGKVGVEIAKTPGYLGGLAMAGYNETFGDGKDSMGLAVDNAWINAFEQLDQGIKDFIPVHVSRQVEEGNLLDKISSGAWWATQGADGIGFMLAMLAPGAAVKALKVGKALGVTTEVLANSKFGKGVKTASNIFKPREGIVTALGENFVASSNFMRNADGVTAALINTVVESSAEAAGIYDNTYKELKEQVRLGRLSEDTAKQMAGEKAANVFKSNMFLLMGSNLLEQAWVFKAFGTKPDSVLNKAMTNGVIDYDKLKSLGSKGWKDIVTEYSKDFGKNAVKEGLFEEGLQTIIEQRASEGQYGLTGAVKQLFGDILEGEPFLENKELHESMFLGAVLGGGMGLISQYAENQNLRKTLNGYNKDFDKPSLLGKLYKKLGGAEQKEGKGLINLITDTWTKEFKSDLSSVMTDGKIDEVKLRKASEEGKKELVLHALYDAAVASKDQHKVDELGLFIAYNYTQPFLGQPGMETIFKDHVKNQLSPAWQERFEKHWNRKPSTEEVRQFEDQFVESGDRVFKSWNKANDTNFPERYYRPSDATPEQYGNFRSKYFQIKVETLMRNEALNSTERLLEEGLNNIRHKIEKREDGNYHLIAGNKFDLDEGKVVAEYNYLSKMFQKERESLTETYNSLFTKEGVKNLYDAFTEVRKAESDLGNEIAKDNATIKVKIEKAEQKVKEVKDKVEDKAILKINNAEVPVQKVDDKIVTEDGVELPKGDLVEAEIVDKHVEEIVENTPATQIQQESVSKVEDTEEDIAVTKINSEEEKPESNPSDFAEIGKTPINHFVTTGRHVLYDVIGNKMVHRRLPDGLPVLGTSQQQLWQKHLENITDAHTLRVVTIENLKQSPEIYTQVFEEAGAYFKETDVWTILYLNDSPVIDNGRYVFTSMSRPETIYRDGVAKVSESFLQSQGGYEAAQRNYTEWWNKQTDTIYSIAGVSNGHILDRVIDGRVAWNKASENLPPKGKIVINQDGVVQKGDSLMKVKKGDIIYEHATGLYPLRPRNLTSDEVSTIINMFSLIRPDKPLSSVKFEGDFVYNGKPAQSIGVFYDENKKPLIQHFFNLGRRIKISKDKKSLIIRQNDTDSVVQISNLADRNSNDFKFLREVLLDTRRNVLDLKGKNSKFTFENTLEVSSVVDYQKDLLEDVLTTTNVINKNYTSRLGRNAYLGHPQITPVKKEVVERKKFEKRSVESLKVLSVDDVIKEKLISGEIKKFCK